ncbi:MAG: TadE/TadG family type IV pilus assembly protein [Sphingomicrobium sp.]
MTLLQRVRADESGASAVEMALSLPILLTFIFGMMQVGMIMAADAGMQHALGEGARMATLFPTPSDAAIKTKIADKVFGTYIGSYTVSDPATTQSGTTRYTLLQVSYTVTPNYIFFTGPPIVLTRTKRVYQTEAVAT